MRVRPTLVPFLLLGCLGVLATPLARGQPASPVDPGALTPEQILQNTQDALAKVKDYTGVLLKQELFGKKLVKETLLFKFAKPLKVYVKFLDSHKGREVIYVSGWNNDKLRVHKGSFPDITLSLNPQSSMAMENNHHTIREFGLENSTRMASANLKKALQNKDGTFQIKQIVLDGRPVYQVSVTFPRKGETVVAGKKETLWDIARRTGQDMYMILHSSEGKYDDPGDVDAGDKVFVPTYYGSRSELTVDRAGFYPVRIEIYDWTNRLYESYEYKDLKFNVNLAAPDFDPDNKGYNF